MMGMQEAAGVSLGVLAQQRRGREKAERRWYTLECVEGRDKEVYGRLAALGFEVWRPVVLVRVTKRWQGKALPEHKRPRVYAPVFGRFLFAHVEMSDSVFSAILQQPGVHDWLCYAGTREAAAVADEHIHNFRKQEWKRAERAVTLRVGDAVRVVEGAFAGQLVVVDDVDMRGAVRADVDIFGRPTPTVFPVGHVELVEQGRRPPIEPAVKRRPKRA